MNTMNTIIYSEIAQTLIYVTLPGYFVFDYSENCNRFVLNAFNIFMKAPEFMHYS